MKNIRTKILAGALLLAVFSFTLPTLAAEKSEDQLIADLNSPKDNVVTSALQNLEKKYPTSTKALPAIEKLLSDPRTKVARKAARVLGSLHAQVSADDVAAICKLLKSSDTDTVIDGLKSLRGLNATSAVPEIVPLLKSPTVNIVRDACRSLAVLGDKSTIPSIEPLLKSSDPKIQKDAMDAIDALKRK